MRTNEDDFKDTDWGSIEWAIVEWIGSNDYRFYINESHSTIITLWQYMTDDDLFWMMQHLPRCSDVIFTKLRFSSDVEESVKEYLERVLHDNNLCRQDSAHSDEV